MRVESIGMPAVRMPQKAQPKLLINETPKRRLPPPKFSALTCPAGGSPSAAALAPIATADPVRPSQNGPPSAKADAAAPATAAPAAAAPDPPGAAAEDAAAEGEEEGGGKPPLLGEFEVKETGAKCKCLFIPGGVRLNAPKITALMKAWFESVPPSVMVSCDAGTVQPPGCSHSAQIFYVFSAQCTQ